MPISKAVMKSILETIQDHHISFLAEILGQEALEHDEVTRLLTKGMLPKDPTDLIQKAYEFGMTSGDEKLAPPRDMTLVEFIRYNSFTRPSLSFDEQTAVTHARETAATYIRGLSGALVKKAQAIVVEGDRKLRRAAMIKGKIVDERAIAKEVITAIKKAVEAQKSDFFKIAATEVSNALQEGRLHAIVKSSGDDDPWVYKKPQADCCAYCKLLFLKADGITPRLYRLSEMIENGSNVGRKPGRPVAKSCGWKATVGSVHPCCRCLLKHMPPGFEFSEKGVPIYTKRALG